MCYLTYVVNDTMRHTDRENTMRYYVVEREVVETSLRVSIVRAKSKKDAQTIAKSLKSKEFFLTDKTRKLSKKKVFATDSETALFVERKYNPSPEWKKFVKSTKA